MSARREGTVSAARALIELLGLRGVDALLGNPGSEFVPLVEAYAELRDELRDEPAAVPRPITVAHESVAVHMAYGAYLASERPQAVMVHTTVGTANASLALMNAARMNIPLLFLAGRTPVSERGRRGARDKFIHWAQEMFDQGAMVREWVKWDYELRDAAMLPEVLDRALAIAMSPPRGPVYLMLPRELLYAPVQASAITKTPSVCAESAAAPDAHGLREVLAAIGRSRRPLLLTKTAGTRPETVALLERAVEQQRLAVISEDAHCVNIAADHRCFGGFSHAGALSEADLLICLDVDVPWIPQRERPRDDARVVHVGDEPLFSRLPFRGHRGEQMLRCDPALFLRALGE
ncbi:MAG: hypothetical protein KC503_43870, partial [Myxococcales bacterium]|nr:hypothetical protein [Myxococcales bacterium]